MSYAREPAGRLRQNTLGARVSRTVLESFLEPSANSASNVYVLYFYFTRIVHFVSLTLVFTVLRLIFCMFLPRYFTCVPQGSRLDQLERRRHSTVTAALADIRMSENEKPGSGFVNLPTPERGDSRPLPPFLLEWQPESMKESLES